MKNFLEMKVEEKNFQALPNYRLKLKLDQTEKSSRDKSPKKVKVAFTASCPKILNFTFPKAQIIQPYLDSSAHKLLSDFQRGNYVRQRNLKKA